ncbi:MAG: HU family DNA-binding protein [candidate division Zixibacteria bacterium]|nr:HU family DNA-binding protein [candidate division Zixibacteria bacterium]
MTKEELVQRMAKDVGIPKTKATMALNSFIGGVTSALKKGKKVSFVGFGTFSVGKRKARMGRNPRTGAEIKIAASRVPKFRAGKALKDAVR